MQVESSQLGVAVSLPLLLVVGWAAALAVSAYGAWKHHARALQVGLALVGLMILVSPLSWYVYASGRPDLYTIGAVDLVLLAVLAFLGGAVALLGFAWPRWRAAGPAKR